MTDGRICDDINQANKATKLELARHIVEEYRDFVDPPSSIFFQNKEYKVKLRISILQIAKAKQNMYIATILTKDNYINRRIDQRHK